jgi:hypothetical protein
MAVLKRGSGGAAVKALQVRLNARVEPSPRLRIDGRFGPATEAAVIRFQDKSKLKPDGIVGPKTGAALDAPPARPPPPHLTKFLTQLGTVDDFVDHVAQAERNYTSLTAALDSLSNFIGTSSGKRYLLLEGDRVGVIDFRHFFAAAVASHNGLALGSGGARFGGSPGETLLLGVGNEIRQCVDEASRRAMNSCFSGEDLGSNRLGADFGELVTVQVSMASTKSLSQLLRDYLAALRPVAPHQVNSMKRPGRWDQAVEMLWAIGSGMSDLLIPRAY